MTHSRSETTINLINIIREDKKLDNEDINNLRDLYHKISLLYTNNDLNLFFTNNGISYST